ncbi:MAG TPA: RNA-binding domain-containing protein [Candidatus Bathyarchaeia archaeon]|nr:RNA-binding domain-containing protein [Candidatus Bathyarchaeia archaeon]
MDSPVQAYSVTISTIIHATEDSEKVSQGIRNLYLGETLLSSSMNRAKGHHGNEIVTLVFATRNAKSVEGFLQMIWSRLSELDRTEVFSSLTSRIDNAGTLFLRIDKQAALKGKIRLENTDPIKIAISFRTKSPKGDGLVEEIQKKLGEIHG